MTDTTAPKPNSNPAQLALIAAIAAVVMRLVGSIAFDRFYFEYLVFLLFPVLALLFVGLKKFVAGIVFGALTALSSVPFIVRDLISSYYLSQQPLVVLVDVLALASAVAIVILAARANSARKAANPALQQQVQSVPQGPSDRKWVTALLLSLFFGLLGFDRLYVGRTGLAIAKLLTAGGLGVWALVDFIILCAGKMNDVHGRPLQR